MLRPHWHKYDKDNLLEETNSSGAVVARYAETEKLDEPLAMLRSSTTSLYQADGLGSVTSLSNGAGALAQTYTFDSFGKETASSGSLVHPFQYAGREADSETGLYFYRARYYDPAAGRFISEDPVRFTESTNFHPYIGNYPSTYKDPFGQGIVDCAAELAKLAYLEGVKAKRLAENAVSSCKDPGHQKSTDQIQNAIDKQRARANIIVQTPIRRSKCFCWVPLPLPSC